MSKISNISKSLVERYNINQLEADSFVVELFSIIRESLDKEKVVKVKGLGTFKLSEMNARESVDVNTGERILIEGRPKITFTPENSVRDRINSPFAQFESIDIEDDVDFSNIDEKYKLPEETVKNEEKEDQPELKETQEKVEATEDVKPENSIILNKSDKEFIKEDITVVIPQTVEEDTVSGNDIDKASASNKLYCEDLIREELTHSRKIIKLLYSVLGLLIVTIILTVAYFGYKLSSGSLNLGLDISNKNLEKNITVKSIVKNKVPVVKTKMANTTQHVEAKVDSSLILQQLYNKDTRVKTGAYVIIGLDTTVQVKNGQTLSSISKYYLGEGMECYVEVFNGGIKDLKIGDRIKIPKLKLKKLLKR